MGTFAMHLEIDEYSVTITDCPRCSENRLATFDVIAITDDGAGKLTEVTRCYSCNPHSD